MPFRTTLDAPELAAYAGRLLATHLPDGRDASFDLEPHVVTSLERLENCFAGIRRKYYTVDGAAVFDHLNSDHMAMWLWFLGNQVWRATGEQAVPTKLFYLNKVMHGLDLYFSVAMPEVFLLVHPVGSVIGAAEYGEHLVVYQNCTIGSEGGAYPRFGDGAILYARSTVLGACHVGDDVVFAANSFVIDTDVPANSIVVGQYPHQRILPNPTPVRQRMFGSD
jgi:serine O-acetyltransferase